MNSLREWEKIISYNFCENKKKKCTRNLFYAEFGILRLLLSKTRLFSGLDIHTKTYLT